MANKIEQYRTAFFEEANEHLGVIEAGLMQLERSPLDDERVNEVFRSVHSIKGGAATFDMPAIASFSHVLETHLDRVRSGAVPSTSRLMGELLNAVDSLRGLVEGAEEQRPVSSSLDGMIDNLERLLTAAASESLVATKPTEESASTKNWEIDFQPGLDTFSTGLDPALLLRELGSLGTVQVTADLSRLPALRELDAQRCYISWRIELESPCRESDLQQVFVFVSESSNVAIRAAVESESPATPAAPVVIAATSLAVEPEPGSATIAPADPSQSGALPEAAAVNLSKLRLNGELVADFINDFQEHLENAEKYSLELDRDPTSAESLNALYRSFHTMKGVASFFGLTEITTLSHAAEGLLNMVRDGNCRLCGQSFELILASLDALARLLARVPSFLEATTPPACDGEAQQLVDALRVLTTQCVADGSGAATQPIAVAATESTPIATEVVTANTMAEEPVPSVRLQQHELKETVKVDRGRLDKLIDMIGELVIGEAMVRQEVTALDRCGDVESISQLHRTVRELQEMSLSLRMVPIASIFQKMNRIVRDVARKLGKEVRFETQGEDTELDKTMVDQLGDPLMHMVRNAVDHGIELPDQRIQSGKPTEGVVQLRAFLRSGNIYIELEDDGHGLDRAAILRKAIERGIVDPADADNLPDREVWNLVFAPGFSTAAQVTDVSGRGVGMDVVRRNIQAMNGTSEIESRAGQGSVFRIRLPLTMAIVDGLIVSLGGETFILPLVSVVESLRPLASDVKSIVGRGKVICLRDETIPLVPLYQIFNRPARETDPAKALVVIVESDGRRLALLVDELVGQVQAVMKSLEANYQKVPGVAGATILGNGEVAFILDVPGLVRLYQRDGEEDGTGVPSPLCLN